MLSLCHDAPLFEEGNRAPISPPSGAGSRHRCPGPVHSSASRSRLAEGSDDCSLDSLNEKTEANEIHSSLALRGVRTAPEGLG